MSRLDFVIRSIFCFVAFLSSLVAKAETFGIFFSADYDSVRFDCDCYDDYWSKDVFYEGVGTRATVQLYPAQVLNVVGPWILEAGVIGRNYKRNDERFLNNRLSLLEGHLGGGLGVDVALIQVQGVVGVQTAFLGYRVLDIDGRSTTRELNYGLGAYGSARILFTVFPFVRVGIEGHAQFGKSKFEGLAARRYQGGSGGVLAAFVF